MLFPQDYGLAYDPVTRSNDAFPFQNYSDISKRGSHGTAVAGIIAGVKNNSVCGVGGAYHATLAGKLLLF